MKKQLLSVAICCLFFLTATAQKPFQGTIKSKLTIEGVTDPNVLSAFPENTEKLVLGNKSKSLTSLYNGAVLQSDIIDGDYKIVYTILEIQGMGKYYLKTTQKELEKEFSKYKYSYDYTQEYITILNYNCQKVTVTKVNLEDDSKDLETVWVTKDPAFSDACNFAENPGLVGFALKKENRKELETGDVMTITVEATGLIPNNKLKATEFYLPSDAKNGKEDENFKAMFGIDGDE